MDVVMHMKLYQLAIAQRWKRTCWTGNKMVSLIQSRCIRVQVSYIIHTSTDDILSTVEV